MTDTTTGNGPHLAEGDVIRFIDGEMPGDERSAVAAHLLSCRECSAMLDDVRGRRAAFAEMIAGYEIPALDPDRRARSLARIERAAAEHRRSAARPGRAAFLRAAAVGGIAVASALTVSPVRAFVADVWSSVADRVERLAGGAPERPEPRSATVALDNSTVGFVPSSDVFVLEVASAQADGSLILGVGAGASVTARAVDAAEPVEIVVLPEGMRIENHPDATGDYAIGLPATLREVRVRVGDAPDVVYPMDSLTNSWISVVPLRAPDGRATAEP